MKIEGLTPCAVCKDKKEKLFRCKSTLGSDSVFDLVECVKCGVLFFNPLPEISQLNEFYSASYYNFDKFREEGKGMVFARNLKRLKKTGRFLDVGCATGYFINGIKKYSD